jgi:hypothetical protein
VSTASSKSIGLIACAVLATPALASGIESAKPADTSFSGKTAGQSIVELRRAAAGTNGKIFTSAAWSADGHLIATGGGDSDIEIWKAEDLSAVRSLKVDRRGFAAGSQHSLAFSADGNQTNLTANINIDGYTVVAVVPQNAAGFGATEFKNDTTGSIYVAMIGTTFNFGSGIADLAIALQADPVADADALAFVQIIVANNPGATVQIGGHSLGRQEAAFVSSETGLSALVENAPDPAATIAGSFGDAKVHQINDVNDIVGNYAGFRTDAIRKNAHGRAETSRDAVA